MNYAFAAMMFLSAFYFFRTARLIEKNKGIGLAGYFYFLAVGLMVYGLLAICLELLRFPNPSLH